MDYNVDLFNLLRDEFPKVDVRIIKATVLEHEDDVNSALEFLKSVADEDDETDMYPHGDEGIADCKSSAAIVQQNGFMLRNDTNSSRGDEEIADCGSSAEAVHQNGLMLGNGASAAIAVPEDASIGSDLNAVSTNLSSSISQISLTSLEEIVELAKKDKEIVTNLVEEVSNLRRKADEESAAALRAKNEAAMSGGGLLRKADEMCRRNAQKKEDNLLRMGEIYGEKAVLATEARGLRSRLEQVNLQKDRAVTILNEIKIKLQDLCGEALEERLMAEEDGKVKEKLAQDILTAEETSMAAIEEQSRKLDIEAERCLQLKEVLSRHGSIIDSIQGEMCVLCEDAESFRRQVDGGMWSSISIESLPANVNPEGPYSFRKYSTSSSQESGQSYEGLCIEKPFYSILSAPFSQGMEGSGGQNDLCQVYNDEAQQRLSFDESAIIWDNERLSGSLLDTSVNIALHGMLISGSHCGSNVSDNTDTKQHDSPVNIVNSESPFSEGSELMSSNQMVGNLQSGKSSVDNVGMSKKLSSSFDTHSNGSWDGSRLDDRCGDPEIGDRFTDVESEDHILTERFPLHEDPAIGDRFEMSDARIIFSPASSEAGEWFFAPTNMEESKSSTSSSLIKVESDDYNSM